MDEMVINLDQVRIEHAARARRDGDMVENLCAALMDAGKRLEELQKKADALNAELESMKKGGARGRIR